MAKMKYEVEHVDPRGEDPGTKLQNQIEHGASQGKQLLQVIPLFNEILLVWQIPTREQRG